MPRGRRPGSPDTRAAILAAARAHFASAGFAGTTMRAVAAEAGVDAALVHHYFGSKDDLFVAALQLPIDIRSQVAPVIAEGPDGAGERLVRTLLSVWDDPDNQPALQALARSLISGERTLLTDGFIPVVIGPLLSQLVRDRPEERIPLVASQVIGLIVTRYVVAMEPMARADPAVLAARIGPTIQRYLTGDLD
jgi:AcrR family transcriptional regulator